ncbi:hypothetical protein CVS40_6862 [Lucilia cuprina]|nr:hypothetical protein CVS40_6862 [Lucilia cuprina]
MSLMLNDNVIWLTDINMTIHGKDCRLRNKVKPVIRKRRKELDKTRFLNIDSKKFWKLLKEDGVIKTDLGWDTYEPDSLNEYFISVQRQSLYSNPVYSEEFSANQFSHSGFRHGYSTTTLLTSLTDAIRHGFNNRECSVLVSLDLSKAFDTIDYNLLIRELQNSFSFSSTACKLVYSFLSERAQYVDCNKKQY